MVLTGLIERFDREVEFKVVTDLRETLDEGGSGGDRTGD